MTQSLPSPNTFSNRVYPVKCVSSELLRACSSCIQVLCTSYVNGLCQRPSHRHTACFTFHAIIFTSLSLSTTQVLFLGSLLLEFSCRRALLSSLPFPPTKPPFHFCYSFEYFQFTFSGALSCSLMLELSRRRTLLPPFPFLSTKPSPSPGTSGFNRLISSVVL